MASNHSLEVAEPRGKIVCQICETPARPGKTKWYRCLNLHHICHDCKTRQGGEIGIRGVHRVHPLALLVRRNLVVNCSCLQPISKNHCEWTEEFLKKFKGLKTNCKNAKNGCKEAFDENALEEHESECVYSFVPCMERSLGCKEKVIFKNVIQHYEKKHGTLIPMDNNSKRKASMISHVKIDLNGKHFILKSIASYKKNSSVNWVYLIGSPNEAKHFSFTLKFFGPNSTNVYRGKVASIDESYETLYVSGKVCTFELQAFDNQFKNEDGKFEYSLEIRNLKEEVKDENVDSGASDIEDSN